MNAVRANTVPPSLRWVTGFAVIVFSAAGIGAFMRWIPDSLSGPRDSVMDRAAGVRATGSARATPVREAGGASIETTCTQCGVIESMREVDLPGDGSPAGAAGGSDGVPAHQPAGGGPRDVMAVLDAAGRLLAGNDAEKRVKAASAFQITIRFGDGTSRVIDQPDSPAWRTGDKIKLVDGRIEPDA